MRGGNQGQAHTCMMWACAAGKGDVQRDESFTPYETFTHLKGEKSRTNKKRSIPHRFLSMTTFLKIGSGSIPRILCRGKDKR